jgi:DNA-binding Lrp family transcriptional regulator
MKAPTAEQPALSTLPTPSAGSLLRSWLSARIESNPAYSLRAMARNFGVSPAYLSQVMNGHKRLPIARAIQFSQVMKLDASGAEALLRAAAPRTGAPAGASYQSLEFDQFKAMSGWYHVAILDLAETRGFRGEAAWIAKRLKISPVQAAEALERLQDLGLLTRKRGSLRKSSAHMAVSAGTSRGAIREHHKQMIGKALEALGDATPEAFAKRSVTGITLTVNPAKLEEAYTMINDFRRHLEAHLSTGAQTEVYQLNVQFFNLSHELKTRSTS